MARTSAKTKRAIATSMAEAKRLGGPEKLPVPLKTVVIFVSAQGVIDNGGLEYFFESDFPGAPPYSLFVEAYRNIGAAAEATAIAEAADVFPFANPHKHLLERNEFLERFQSDENESAANPFDPYNAILCGSKTVWEKLNQYVAENEAAFDL
jgi:hypothetical protein